MVENLVENACSGFCVLSHSLCVNMRRTLAQNWHTFVPCPFMDATMRHIQIPPQEPQHREGVVYFLSAAGQDSYPIKIGHSNTHSLPRRMSQLQTAVPWRLDPLYVGEASRDTEQRMHGLLSKYWMRGEWFERSPTVQQWVDALNEDDPNWRDRFDLCAFRGGFGQ